MTLFAPPRCFDPNKPELIDRPGTDPALVREELQILESINRYSRGDRLMVNYVEQCVESYGLKSLSVLDLGTGIADIPRAIVGWARSRPCGITVLAVDLNPIVLQAAEEACRDWPEIRLEQRDLTALPYDADSFDLVLCSMALHHFGMTDAVGILRRIKQVARLRYVVNDLRRNWLTIWLIELLTRTIIRSRIARHDGPQSFRAAFTVGELRGMAHQAGMKNFRINKHHGCFRMALEGKE